MNLLDLMVKVGVDDQASKPVEQLGSNLKGNLAGAAGVATAAIAALAAAVAALTAAFVAGVKETAAYGDNIDKMSQKMGMSAEAYQEWDSVLRHSGSSIESMKMSMKTLANAAESNNEAFQRLGITQEQLATLNQQELFEATIAGLQNVEDTTERTYLAGQLLGRGATELGPLLNASAEEVAAMRDRTHELGFVMSDEAVKASAKFTDSMQDLKDAIGGFKRAAFSEFLPAFTSITDGLQEIIIGNNEQGLELIRSGIDNIAATLQDNLPRFIEAGMGIIGGITQGLLYGIPTMLTALLQGLVEIVNNISNNTDAVLEAALEMFMAIATAVLEAAPQIVKSLLNLIVNLVETIISHAPDILAAAVQLIFNMAVGIAQTAGEVLAAIGTLLWDLVSAPARFIGDMVSAGMNLIDGLIQGIKSSIGRVLDTILGGLRNAVQGALEFLGIASPSKLFKWIGDMTMQGMAEGIERSASEAVSAMEDAVGMVSSAADVDATIGVGAAGELGRGSGDIFNITMNVTADSETTLESLIRQAERARGSFGRTAYGRA